jgi:hypothetical protein
MESLLCQNPNALSPQTAVGESWNTRASRIRGSLGDQPRRPDFNRSKLFINVLIPQHFRDRQRCVSRGGGCGFIVFRAPKMGRMRLGIAVTWARISTNRGHQTNTDMHANATHSDLWLPRSEPSF